MRTIEKAVRIAHSQGQNWKEELYGFLLDYRTTPHVAIGVAPADLLFNRHVRNRLPDKNTVIPGETKNTPENSENCQPRQSTKNSSCEVVRQRDVGEKEKMKSRADARNRGKIRT